MLKVINLTKYLVHFSLQFVVILNKKFLVLNLFKNNLKYYIQIPEYIEIKKFHLNLIISRNNIEKNFQELKNFENSLLIFFNNFRIQTKKSLLINGLGLKVSIKNNVLIFKLGYSNEITLLFDCFKFLINLKKYGLKGMLLNIYTFNKVILGNLAEKIYKLKKADQYKLRGISNKDKVYVLKIIKKK